MPKRQESNKFLRKLWHTVFGEHTAGLVSPESLERQARGRLRCRADELVLIRQMERDINDIREGKKVIDEGGRVVENASYGELENIKLSSIIVTEGSDTKPSYTDLTFSNMMSAVQHDVNLLDLLRTLTVFRIYIFAEAKAASVSDQSVAETHVDRQWFLRWREAAQDVRSETLQLMWAKILGAEVQKSGSFTLRAIDCLRQMTEREAEMLHMLSRLSMGDFIYKEANDYFKPEIHQEMFEKLEETGVIYGVRYGLCSTVLESHLKASFKIVLRCQNKAMFVQGEKADLKLKIPIYGITSLGKSIMRLGNGDADMGYLWAVSNDLREKGFKVTLGDWVGEDDSTGLFTSRVET